MSVDKLVDSTQLDTDLTSVANAIRTKGGTSAALAFPAGFVSAIQAIPTGGGNPGYESGTFTPASSTQSISVSVSALYTHFAVLAIKEKTEYTFNDGQTPLMGTAFKNGGSSSYQYVMDSGNGSQFVAGVRDNDWRGTLTLTSSTITASFIGNGAKVKFHAGNTYRWFAWTEA